MGVALVSDLSDLSDLSDKMGAPLYTPRVCGAAVWFGSGANVPVGYARLFLWQRRYAGCGGVALVSDLSDLSDKMGAPLYTPRVCCAAVWYGSGADLPLGYARLVLWQRWCACCGGVTLVSDLSDLSDLSDKMGAPLYTPRVCVGAV